MRRWIPCTGCLAVLAMMASGCGGTSEPAEGATLSPAVAVTLAAVATTPVDAPYEAVGTVRPKTASAIQSKAVGHVTAVHVRAGDRVLRGQVLVEIDDREAAAQVQRARSALEEAREARREVDRAVQAAVHAKEAADADEALARATYERYEELRGQGAVSSQAFDEAHAKWKGASAQAARAEEMLASARLREGEADARVEQAEAELANAQALLTHTKVTAPFDGLVTRKTVDVGDLASPGATLLEVEGAEQYRLEAQVDESLVHAIQEGDAVPVTLDAAGRGTLAGTVAEIVPSADPASRTFLVKIDLPQDEAIRSGMFGRARFTRGQQETLTVPASAVVRRGQLAFVYAVGEDNTARMRLVTIGKRYGDQVEVLSGLDAGERVVAEPGAQVADGTKVRDF